MHVTMTLKFITQFVYRNVFLAGIKENNVISTNPIVVDKMLPMMAKHADIWTLELVSIKAFHL